MKFIYLLFSLLFFVSFNVTITAQQRISGKITDNNGEGLPGVNIVVKGTNNVVISNQEGEFYLSNVKTQDILVFSYIGYMTKEESN